MKKTISTDDIEQLLGNRFCPPAWAFIPQVRNATGFPGVTRTADAIAMGLWPSRGLFLHGFEIKVYRNDWLKELNRPEKAEEIAQFCDYWWVVAPKDLIKIEEVPALWGLMIPHGTTTKIIKEAKQLQAKSPDKSFLAAILRRAQQVITPDRIKKECFESGKKRGKELAQDSLKWERENHQELQEKVKKFEKIIGQPIDYGWRTGDVAEAVKMVLNGEHLRVKKQLKGLLEQAKEITKGIEKELTKEPHTKQ